MGPYYIYVGVQNERKRKSIATRDIIYRYHQLNKLILKNAQIAFSVIHILIFKGCIGNKCFAMSLHLQSPLYQPNLQEREGHIINF